jgi:hypothetical protein
MCKKFGAPHGGFFDKNCRKFKIKKKSNLGNFEFDAGSEPEPINAKPDTLTTRPCESLAPLYNTYLVLLVSLSLGEWRDSFLKFRISSNFYQKNCRVHM